MLHQLPHTAVKIAHLVLTEAILQALHHHGVRDRRKLAVRPAADAPGGRIRRNELRMRLFQLLQLTQQLIVFIILNFRRIVLIIAFAVVVEQPAQLLHPLLHRFKSGHINTFLPIFMRVPAA